MILKKIQFFIVFDQIPSDVNIDVNIINLTDYKLCMLYGSW